VAFSSKKRSKKVAHQLLKALAQTCRESSALRRTCSASEQPLSWENLGFLWIFFVPLKHIFPPELR
jgi:hypothetical protein